MTVYLDCNATTPMEPEVTQAVLHFMTEEFGNAGSRTHEFGTRAKQAVQRAREQVARVVDVQADEVIFTSGATESNNLAILGLVPHAERVGRRHIVSTQIEHKAVLEPLEALGRRGFDVTLVPPTTGGWVDAEAIRRALRPETVLVSVMHVNNETGVAQPLGEIATALAGHDAYLHVDAAQGFGKELHDPRLPRIDLLSLSGHKVFGPKGIGALVARRRGFQRVPLEPLAYGGGQERGLRPGTLPVHLIVGLGAAAEIALRDQEVRVRKCRELRAAVLSLFQKLGAQVNGDSDRVLPHVLNASVPGLDSEAVMVAAKGLVAMSNGSACTSRSHTPSHVLTAMGMSQERVRGALRLSWCHFTPEPPWNQLLEAIRQLL
jgi:cysteine desulfurase